MTLPLAFGTPGPIEIMGLLVLGLLFFGKRLPEVGRSFGQTIVQFKKGLNDATSAQQDESKRPVIEQAEPSKQVPDPSANFKFDPHTGEPINR